jgi:uncharacterized protein (DUF885 family)
MTYNHLLLKPVYRTGSIYRKHRRQKGVMTVAAKFTPARRSGIGMMCETGSITQFWAISCVSMFALMAYPTYTYGRDTHHLALDRLAARFVAQSLNNDPTIAYSSGLTISNHGSFADRSPHAMAAWDSEKANFLRTLRTIDPLGLDTTSRATYAVLKEQLEADLQMRVCRTELWNVNHLVGWQSAISGIAQQQPVGSTLARRQALKRWQSLPTYIDTEISNLKLGLASGYSAPQSVVRRVIGQVDSLTATSAATSPLNSPAQRDDNVAFKASFVRVVERQINPALKRYRDYLQDEYLPKARESLAVSALPNGVACYQATLRFFTTLDRTPEQVFELGQQTMASNRADVIRIGSNLFGITDFDEIVAKSKDREENRFRSREELLNFSTELLSQAKQKTEGLVDQMPAQAVIIEPLSDVEEASGVTSYYEPSPDPAKPGVYRIQLVNWEVQTRGSAQVTLVHESWPGHHLQMALAREIVPDTPLSKLSFNSAYVEGWARYAEALGEEAGVYTTDDAKIIRRVWPAHGMVADPGLHMFGWSRQHAIEFLVSSGRFDARGADAMVDRIAMLPGQLTAYDSGGLEIRALRTEAEQQLGTKFNLKQFNRALLEQGLVPLSALREHIEGWVAKQLISTDTR